jgi:hypothetical protein
MGGTLWFDRPLSHAGFLPLPEVSMTLPPTSALGVTSLVETPVTLTDAEGLAVTISALESS